MKKLLFIATIGWAVVTQAIAADTVKGTINVDKAGAKINRDIRTVFRTPGQLYLWRIMGGRELANS